MSFQEVNRSEAFDSMATQLVSVRPAYNPSSSCCTARKIMTCIPVLGLVMQGVNAAWIHRQKKQHIIDAKLLREGQNLEKCALGSHLIGLIGCVFIAAIAANPYTYLALGVMGVFVAMMLLTAKRIENYNDHIRNL